MSNSSASLADAPLLDVDAPLLDVNAPLLDVNGATHFRQEYTGHPTGPASTDIGPVSIP